jgi:hypothetical protein
MTIQTGLIKLRLRLNKLHSSDYDNIPDWTAIEAINKAQLEWIRKQIHGGNAFREGDETSRMRVDDLQVLLKEVTLGGMNKKIYFESKELPKDYLYLKRVTPTASSNGCSGMSMLTTLVEEANVSNYLNDWGMRPSFEWAETFHTLVGNKIRVYTQGTFHVSDISLMYYRRPRAVDIQGYTKEDGTNSSTQHFEFKEDICELILDEATAIIAGSIGDYNNAQMTKGRADQTN